MKDHDSSGMMFTVVGSSMCTVSFVSGPGLFHLLLRTSNIGICVFLTFLLMANALMIVLGFAFQLYGLHISLKNLRSSEEQLEMDKRRMRQLGIDPKDVYRKR